MANSSHANDDEPERNSVEGSSVDVDLFGPGCFAADCSEQFESVDEMVAVPGRGDRSPRHFCEPCSERLRRGPPMTDGGQATTRLLTAYVECPECEATHARPEYVDPDDPPETLEKTCIAYHPARDAGFEGCGEDVELTVLEWRDRDE